MTRGRPFAVWCHAAQGRPHFSLHPVGYIPKMGACGGRSFAVSPPLPLGFADALGAYLEQGFGSSFLESRLLRSRAGSAWLFTALQRRRALRVLLQCLEIDASPDEILAVERASAAGSSGVGADDGDEEIGAAAPRHGPELLPWNEAEALVEHLCEILEGRSLFSDELHAALRERGIQARASVDLLLDEPVRQGQVERLPGVRWTGERWECSRCGSLEIGRYPCARCGFSRCPQCDECRALGASTACSPLYHRPLCDGALAGGRSSAPGRPGIRIELPFDLSPRQKELAGALERLEGGAFVWAACGAGKTEVTLQAIARTLRRGGRALFAVPRRDVADQLARRLQQAVRGAEVVLLSGETPEKYAGAPLIVATVQQALRYRRAFHFVVVDEVDAYPLNAEEWLLRGLLRSVHPKGRIIAMSATPPEAAQRKFGAGFPCFTLPARPHGFPLPVPEVRVDPRLEGAEREGQPPRGEPPWLQDLVEHVRRTSAAARKLLIFVPNVRLSITLPQLLAARGGWRLWKGGERAGQARAREAGHPLVVAGVHAQDPCRREKVRAMESGDIDALVSTTLLERGVTIARLDVLVFAAHCERVYGGATLVQMAGRAGRKREDPSGRVVFWGARETPAMREAISCIAALNRQAQEEGLLVGEEGTGVPCHP